MVEACAGPLKTTCTVSRPTLSALTKTPLLAAPCCHSCPSESLTQGETPPDIDAAPWSRGVAPAGPLDPTRKQTRSVALRDFTLDNESSCVILLRRLACSPSPTKSQPVTTFVPSADWFLRLKMKRHPRSGTLRATSVTKKFDRVYSPRRLVRKSLSSTIQGEIECVQRTTFEEKKNIVHSEAVSLVSTSVGLFILFMDCASL